MSNINNTKLICTNSDEWNEIIKTISFSDSELEIKDGCVYIRTGSKLLEDEIKQLSLHYPHLVITAEYSFESDWSSTIYIDRFVAGSRELLGAKANYGIINEDLQVKEIMGLDYDELLKKLFDTLSKIDTVVYSDSGFPRIKFDLDVNISVENERYVMKSTRACGDSGLELECFKRMPVVLERLVPVKNSLPF